jgi:hypothetical protein
VSFRSGISNFNEKDFKNHLKLQTKGNYKQIFCYAHKYKDMLLTGDAKGVGQPSISTKDDIPWKLSPACQNS